MSLTKDERAAWEARGEADAAKGTTWNRPTSDGGILAGLIDDSSRTKEQKAAYDLGQAKHNNNRK